MNCDATAKQRPVNATLLECREVRFAYSGRIVLDGVSLRIHDADALGVIGPNGSGKSTLIKLLSGLLPPMEGMVTLNGVDLASLSRNRVAREVAVVAQEEITDFGFTVWEEIMLGRAPHHRGLHFEDSADRSVVERVMAMTGVEHLAHRIMDSLSGGERQRVRMARALAQEPRLLLLDEPTNHLDLYSLLALQEMLGEINVQGIALLVVSHDINFVAETCRHVSMLHEGTFHAGGSPADVITAENLAHTFHISALVDRNPVSQAPRMTPVARLEGQREQPGNGDSSKGF